MATGEAALVAAARAGDAAAFAALVDGYRAELHRHCYRMLGSAHDADDAVQEALLRAWKAVRRFDGRQSVRPWLYRIATNRCLTMIEARGRRELPTDLSPGAAATEDTLWLEPYPDVRLGPEAAAVERESVELAFVAALQELSALQRAVLVLRAVLEFPAREVAELLDTSVAAVNSALQRARDVVARRGPARSQRAELAELGGGVRVLAERYARAWESGDVDAIVAMLADDVRLAMPPMAECYVGPAAVAAALGSGPIHHRWRLLPTMANGQLALAGYRWDDARGLYAGEGLDVLTLRDGRISAITAFLVDDLEAYGLPRTLPGGSR
ncbi:RNA polymerase subunit sigma-70 [Dactylosporangium sp. CA-139066]|uniref:RNA polymerase subunit sigma-70 n=1 Tax=Dactylosporangium sp. CA-139066 TaxID=3239930 RepID=UPI003D8F00B0